MPRDELPDTVACERRNAFDIPTVGDDCGRRLAVCLCGRRLLGGRSDTSVDNAPSTLMSPQAKEREWERWSS